MILSYILLTQVLARPLNFAETPVAAMVAEGRAKARVGKPRDPLTKIIRGPVQSEITSILGQESKTIGTWTNGSSKQSVEHATWISPELVSRWLGFNEAREFWDQDVLPTKWQMVRHKMSGKLNFVVELSAFPKLPFQGTGEYQKPRFDSYDNVRFVLTSDGRFWNMNARQIRQIQGRKQADVDHWPWWLDTPISACLATEHDTPPDPPLPFGDFNRTYYWVDLPIPAEIGETFELRVLSKGKERVAKYSLRAR